MNTRMKPVNYRGYSIEQELNGVFSVWNLGYMSSFKTFEAAKAYVDSKRD